MSLKLYIYIYIFGICAYRPTAETKALRQGPAGLMPARICEYVNSKIHIEINIKTITYGRGAVLFYNLMYSSTLILLFTYL